MAHMLPRKKNSTGRGDCTARTGYYRGKTVLSRGRGTGQRHGLNIKKKKSLVRGPVRTCYSWFYQLFSRYYHGIDDVDRLINKHYIGRARVHLRACHLRSPFRSSIERRTIFADTYFQHKPFRSYSGNARAIRVACERRLKRGQGRDDEPIYEQYAYTCRGWVEGQGRMWLGCKF